jgi:hypothetical protein
MFSAGPGRAGPGRSGYLFHDVGILQNLFNNHAEDGC